MTKLQGRVFNRRAQYDALPANTKHEIEAMETYLTSIKSQVFEQHKPTVMKSAVGIKYKDLVEKVDAHLVSGRHITSATGSDAHGLSDAIAPEVSGQLIDQHADATAEIEHKIPTCQQTDTTKTTTASASGTAAFSITPDDDPVLMNPPGVSRTTTHDATHTRHGPNDPIAPGASADLANQQHADGAPTVKDKLSNAAAVVKDKLTPNQPTATKQSATAPSSSTATRSQDPSAFATFKAKMTGQLGDLHTTDLAKQLVVGLVLKGFITPYRESEKLLDLNTREAFDYRDSDLFVPLANELRGLKEPVKSVWDVTPGAIYANLVKRKSSLMQKMTVGSELYAVVDQHSKTLILFHDDVGHAGAVLEIKANGSARMAEDVMNFESGITVATDAVKEVFDLTTKAERDAFVTALRAIGIKGMEGVAVANHPGAVTSTGGVSEGIHNAMDKLTGHDHQGDRQGQENSSTSMVHP